MGANPTRSRHCELHGRRFRGLRAEHAAGHWLTYELLKFDMAGKAGAPSKVTSQDTPVRIAGTAGLGF